jgi:hypothetical protein
MSSYDIPDADPARACDAPPAACPALDAAQRIDHLWLVHACTQEAIQLCDKKCSVLIAVAGSVIAGLLSAVGEGHANLLAILSDAWAVVSLTTLLAAVLVAAVAIKPRLWREANEGSVFWESIVTHGRPQSFAEYLRAQTTDAVAEHLAHQVFSVARVCRRKYAWFAWAFYLTLIGGLLTVIAVVQAQMTSR